ncbi:MAG: tripartite tricarboxylate transporter permease [Actinomycetaceae bacterium]|nr:tripartite tricarboxylate transporter permease [Actinomycetaceae bacterium]MDY5854087.1 tripartite tricarboxylate transporter permease [Arcanobacterium sp.]
MLENWILGFQAIMSPMPLLMMVVGVLAGIVIGALPGLTAVMGVAVLMPFTFSMDPLTGIMMMCGIYTSTIYAGSIPSILMKVPGTPSSAAAILDGYPMAQQGKGGQALNISLWSSFIGSLAGGILLAFTAPMLAAIAVKVGQAEFFMLAVFALTVIASLSEGALIKGLLSGALGLFIATVGMDALTGSARFTFGIPDLRAGLDFIPILIGLFGVSEAIAQFERHFIYKGGEKHKVGDFTIPKNIFKRLIPRWLYGTVIGFLIGVLPGTGGEVGSFVSYNENRRLSRHKETWGKGEPEGLASAEVAHNSAVPGTLAPTITLGIPGNSVAAIMIGVLTVQGLHPGPQLFEGEPQLVYGILWGFILVPFVVFIIGKLGIRAWGQILRIPARLLWPIILGICCIGAFSIRSSVFDMVVMLVAGIVGYLFNRVKIPTTPMVIGLLVGPLAEDGFRRATMLEGGSFEWIFHPAPLIMLILSILSLAASMLRSYRLHKERQTQKMKRHLVSAEEKSQRQEKGKPRQQEKSVRKNREQENFAQESKDVSSSEPPVLPDRDAFGLESVSVGDDDTHW